MHLKTAFIALMLTFGLLGPIGPAPIPQPAYGAAIVGTGFAEETITVSSSAIGITTATCVQFGRQTPAIAEVKTGAIYFTLNSPTATPDSGDYEATPGTIISVDKASYLRMIRQTDDSTVKVTCFRGGQLPSPTFVDKSGSGAYGVGEVAITMLFDGSAETQIAPSNMGASQTIALPGSGVITAVCLVLTTGTLTEADDGSIFMFDTDPVIGIETTDMTVAEAQTVVARFDFTTEMFAVEFAAAQVACLQDLTTSYHAISHVVYHNTDAGTLTDEDIEIHVWYKRDN